MFDIYIKSPEGNPLLTLTIDDSNKTVLHLKEEISKLRKLESK